MIFKEISELFDITGDKFYEFLLESLFVENIFHYAIYRNQLDFLKNLHDCGYQKSDKDFLLALNNLNMLKYIVKNCNFYDDELLLEYIVSTLLFIKKFELFI